MEGNYSNQIRNERIDAVKYWLIVLVIAGHVFRREPFIEIPECAIVWKWIYIFHMPLFVFISGYFSHKKDRKGFITSIWKLLEPLVLYHVILTTFDLIIRGGFSWDIILSPWGFLWYLLSLIYWRLILQVIPDRILRNKKLILSVTFLISIFSGFLPFDRILAIQRTLSFMPFFFLGYYMRGKNLFLPDKYKPLSLIFLILVFVLLILFQQHYSSLYHYNPYKNSYETIYRIILFILSIPMSVAFLNLCIVTPWIIRQGKLTMQYYIYHVIAVLLLMLIVKGLGVPSSFITAMVYTVVITIGIGIASYLPYFEKFTNPSSFLKK